MYLLPHIKHLKATLVCSVLLSRYGETSYIMVDDYSSSKFLDMFEFFNGTDPTNGFVQYLDQQLAIDNGLVVNNNSSVYIGTDHTNITPEGRPSVRLTSKNSYNPGSLVVLDLANMPGGVCGTWPAFWMVGPQWPDGGEIDILEGSNQDDQNSMTLHTSKGCSIASANMSGTISTYDCYIDAEGQSNNEGCSIKSSNSSAYGKAFNKAGGGVYAMEWTNNSISVWFFPRAQIPQDVRYGTPNPKDWGLPMARFQGPCDIPKHFSNNQIVFDLTFCGDLAGNTWSSSSCSSFTSTCESFVSNNPAAFQESYWLINSLRVYKETQVTNRTFRFAR